MKEHYGKLGAYLAALKEANPTSTFELVTVPSEYYGQEPGTEVFFRLFICFDPIKKGFLAGCRRLLCLDGCFIKTFLGGMLLVAIGRDGNDQMYPVAWAVVEGENNDSWWWFMNELKKCLEVSDEGKGWTLVSDQQKGLLNAVASVWGNSEHRNCARHIYANWHKKYKGDELKELFWRAAKAYNIADHKRAIEEMRIVDEEATDAFTKQNPKCFCRCYLNIENKTDVIVNNMAETFNGFIIQSRSKHLIQMLEDIRLAVMTRLVTKFNDMSSKNVVVCPRVQRKKLDKDKDKAYTCTVYPSSRTLFQVKSFDDVSVDISNKTCTCRKWDLTGIPCHHMCAVAAFLRRESEEFVNSYLTKEMYLKAYEYTIPPLPSEKYWPTVELPLDPPPVKIGPGRPKKNRKKDPHETKKKSGKLSRHGILMSCKNCHGRGHKTSKCDKPAAEVTGEKRKRGRPKKSADGQASQSTAAPKVSQTTSTQQSQCSTQQSQGQARRGRPKKIAKTTN
ncbi:uncharacterized protein LOC110934163 [Helianthus annuus]|uniref:uncharacterized protein LOC110934163 n=1 Tax=Helianthus annuus TaxID=4232 RepID=UPI000B906CBB|nr:uncharacterized protein LOC110934163 [Helianthus annuus]